MVQSAQASLDKLLNPSVTDVQQAQSALDQAQANAQKVKNPSAYDVQQAQEAVNSAQASLDKLTNPSATDVAAAQQAVAQAQSSLAKLQFPSAYDVVQAQEVVNSAQANITKLLASNQYDVQAAQASLVQAQANLDLKKNASTAQDIAAAQVSVDQARASLAQAQANLEAATLTAPFAGTIAATGANAGEQISAGTAAVTLVDTHQLRVEAVVGETDIARIKVGQTATVTFDALTNQRVTGAVSVIAPMAITTNGVVNYAVQIRLDPQQAQAAGVRPGMTASATIVSDSRQNVLLDPNRAIKTVSRVKTVQVVDATGKTETRTVQTGLASDQFTEIISGLQAGDKVVIPTTTTASVAAVVPGLTTGATGTGALGGAPAGGPPAGAPGAR